MAKTFERECYDAWSDGCNCVACIVIDLYEGNQSSYGAFRRRIDLLGDVCGYRHGDGVHFGAQLALWPDVRDKLVTQRKRSMLGKKPLYLPEIPS